jgi:hypothetical protein
MKNNKSCILRVFVNSPPPKPEVILTNFFAEPAALLVPIRSRVKGINIYTMTCKFNTKNQSLQFDTKK